MTLELLPPVLDHLSVAALDRAELVRELNGVRLHRDRLERDLETAVAALERVLVAWTVERLTRG